MLLVEVTPSPGLLLFWKGNCNKDYFGFLFQQRSCVRTCWALQHTFLLMKIIGIIIGSLDVEQTNSLVRLINSAGVNASEISKRQELARVYRAPCTFINGMQATLKLFLLSGLDAEGSHHCCPILFYFFKLTTPTWIDSKLTKRRRHQKLRFIPQQKITGKETNLQNGRGISTQNWLLEYGWSKEATNEKWRKRLNDYQQHSERYSVFKLTNQYRRRKNCSDVEMQRIHYNSDLFEK